MDNVDSIFSNFCNISQKLQSFKEQLQNSKVSNETRHSCHRELEKIQAQSGEMLRTAQAAGSAVAGQFAAMNQEIVSTYREIEDRFEDYEVSLIAKDALDLGSLMEKGSVRQLASIVDRLKGRIQFLYKERRPSLQNNKIIQLASQLAQQAIVPAAKRAKLYSLQLIQLLRAMIEETMERAEQLMFPEEAELIMELYAIADLYSHHYVKEGKKRLKAIISLLPKRAEQCLNDLSPSKSAELLIEIAGDLTHGGAALSTALVSQV